MLTIQVPIGEELYDEENNRFFSSEYFELKLEHSLVALSKWEEKHEKPFLSDEKKTIEETIDYIRCMTITPDVPEEVFSRLTQANVDAINANMQAKMTATWFRNTQPEAKNREIITAELIYFWMTAFSIDLEWEHRHLNKLFTLIQVANAKNSKPKKMGRAEAAAQQRELNRRRREQMGTQG